MDGLARGMILTLIRYREHDHAVHCFEFQLYRREDPQYRLIERFESGVVQEEFVDIAAIGILCSWLLHLRFDANLYEPYNNEDN